MKRQSKQPSNIKLNQIKQPLRRQYSTLSTCEYPNESNNPIFGLPISVLEQYKDQTYFASQRGKIKISQQVQPQAYGEIAMNYQQNLRKTVLNHTKNLFKKRNQSCVEKVSLPSTLHLNNKSQATISYLQQRRSQVNDTLSILQKVILKDVNYIEPESKLMPVQASKLPMLARKESKKQKAKSLYFSRAREQQNSHTIYQSIKVIKQIKKVPAQKPYICGWDLQDSPDF